MSSFASSDALLQTPLNDLHLELGARMVSFAGYSMPVQYPSGLISEHHHTRTQAGLFDVSHMGQMLISGDQAGLALERLMPVDVCGLAVGKQRYGLLLNETGGVLDDLMFVNRGNDYFVIVNGACKAADLAHIQKHIGKDCDIKARPDWALLALQGCASASVLSRLLPEVEKLVFMSGQSFRWKNENLFVTRSGYTGEDGFEISVPSDLACDFARELLKHSEVKPIGLGARNSLRLEAGLCLYGQDLSPEITPIEAGLNWAIQKVRRLGGERAGGFLGSERILSQLNQEKSSLSKIRVALKALDRVPVREHSVLQTQNGEVIGEVSSGLLSPTLDVPIAMAFVKPEHSAIGTRLNAIVRAKPVSMEICALPFVPTRYYRG